MTGDDMRTTLTIDDDVLQAAKAAADLQKRTIGEVISEWARNALYKAPENAERNGFPLLTVQKPGAVVTMDLVNQLRDEQP
ncbi:CopG family transcriptional regulator [Asticcacaulis sp.]|uniref:CopG family transcriptional regulator n=1 Tax=Asticcacaulis sp. TaxID=1872648 RepID=UPI00261402AD|nr:CopG family transcriptional regulator [Asticcacaulis sp.]